MRLVFKAVAVTMKGSVLPTRTLLPSLFSWIVSAHDSPKSPSSQFCPVGPSSVCVGVRVGVGSAFCAATGAFAEGNMA